MECELHDYALEEHDDIADWNAAMVPLTVTAHLATGFSSGDPWSPTLDGILAFAFMKEKLGADFGTNIDLHPVTTRRRCGLQRIWA